MDRRIVGWMGVGAALVGLLGGPAAAKGSNWAQGLFTETAHDFGPVPRGAKVRHAFLLTNRLAEPLTILNVRASCGCTIGLASNQPIAPGRSASVEAAMDTSNFVGRKETTLFVTVVTASGKEAEVRLGVASTILSDIVLNPGTIDFGVVTRGETPSRTLTVDRIGAPGWKAVRLISASKALDASLVETARSAAGVGYALTVTLKGDAPAGPIRDEVRIVTNDRESPHVPVLVTGLVRNGGLTASPAMLTLGKAGSAGRFLVRGPKPFRVLAIEGAGDGFEVTAPDEASRPAHVIAISFRPAPGRPIGALRRTFRVRTDLPGEPPLDLTATARVE